MARLRTMAIRFTTLANATLQTATIVVRKSDHMPVTTIDRTRTQRAREVENALASVRMEGLEISSEAETMFRQYVDGKVTSEELDTAFDRYFDRKYGPIRLPRNVCP